MKAKISNVLLTLALAAAVPMLTSAATVLGIVGNAQVSATTIDFGVFPVGAPYAPPGGYGIYEVNLVNPGVFQSNGVTPGETGMIQSLNSAAFPPATAAMTFTPPPGGGANLMVFWTGVTTQTAGPGCVNSPFSGGAILLCDTPNGATATLDLTGYVLGDVASPTTREPLGAVYSQTFAGMTVASLLAAVSGGGTVNAPFSATFTVNAVPEPMTFFLMGIGLVGAGIIVRRRNRVRA